MQINNVIFSQGRTQTLSKTFIVLVSVLRAGVNNIARLPARKVL
jgi:hypothetical protein